MSELENKQADVCKMPDSCCKKEAAGISKCTKKHGKTILFVPLDCVGHVNSLITIADALKHLGHRTVFLFHDSMDGGIKKRGHEVYDCTNEGLVESEENEGSEQKWDNIVNEMGKLWRKSLLDNYDHTTRVGLGSMMREVMKHDDRVQHKLALIKPDLIVIDHYFIQPALIKYGVPWARVYSATPLSLHPRKHRLPPSTLGLPTDWLDTPPGRDPELRNKYLKYDEHTDSISMELYDVFNKYLVEEHGLKPLPTDPISFIYTSPYLNVNMYPEELDYDHVEAPEGWIRCDSILRENVIIPPDDDEDEVGKPDSGSRAEDTDASTVTNKTGFSLPADFAAKPGKLILLSMGTLASGDVALMKRMVRILAQSPHKFIVCRGVNWQKYELADNMWGEKFLPQLEILPQIDMIITHGGNNTITECFYYGVPGFVVCPVFSDQYDNAQRVEEKGLGKRVDAFHCSDEELLGAIETVLADETIRERMKAVSSRMKTKANRFKAVRLFRDLVDGL